MDMVLSGDHPDVLARTGRSLPLELWMVTDGSGLFVISSTSHMLTVDGGLFVSVGYASRPLSTETSSRFGTSTNLACGSSPTSVDTTSVVRSLLVSWITLNTMLTVAPVDIDTVLATR